MIKASKDLQKKNQEKTDLQLRYYDQDQETTNLKFRQTTLEEQLNNMKTQFINTHGANANS